MGATTSTLESDIESAVTKMFENNLYTGGSLSISSERSTEIRLNQAPAEIYLTAIDSPDHHIQHTNNDCSYDIESLTVHSPSPPRIQHYNIIENITTSIPVGIHHNNKEYYSEREERKDLIKEYQLLYKAALKGDWVRAKRILQVDPGAMTTRITVNQETALHIAAAAGHSTFAEKLVELMPSEALESKKGDGETALHVVASAGLTRVAKVMVNKNPNLTQIRDSGERVPLVTALCSANSSDERIKEMVKYLCSVTRDEEPSPYSGVSGGGLICLTIDSGLYGKYYVVVIMHDTDE
ncbi:hypothetical protein MKX01_031096 [Papaver californicum]|nr:hypothetical protein MKX01_031096 [Papaver californicum]